ncbi:stranded at second transmembrane protein isoform X2 [Lycorma delicatula]|uniref:stranded at second transmembrane protein isoform X2 n=1 Tax=Lycorma delicatula TaxID=130591 RepID=UPI003F513FA8
MLWSSLTMLRISIIIVSACILLVNVRGENDTSTTQENKVDSAISTTEIVMSSESAGTTTPGPPPEPPNTGGSVITTIIPLSTNNVSNEPLMNQHKSRALNLTEPPLDDVSMDNDEDDMMEGNSTNCMPGDTFDRSCDETCKCENSGVTCRPRPACIPPYVRPSTDTICHQTPSKEDPCCVLLDCPHGGAMTESTDHCTYKNETYKKGETFNDACEAVCSCEDAGHVSCKPRCSAVKNTTSDRCVAVPDTMDPCCTVVLCDVSLQDHELTRPGSTGPDDSDNEPADIHLISAIPLNSTAVKLNTSVKLAGRNWSVDVSEDENTWTPAIPTQGSTVLGLEPSKTYFVRVKVDGTISNSVTVTLPAAKKVGGMCEYKGKNYTKGEEFHDGCSAYCTCGKAGVECATIDCPINFGLDVLDPNCLSWETQPDNFVPTPPNCCPETVKCKDNGSCIYDGETFANWAHIPPKLSGCEQRCFCEMGNVTCHATCPPVPAHPPGDLPCLPNEAILAHPPTSECCLYWMCPHHANGHHADEKSNKNKTVTNNDKKLNIKNNKTLSQDPVIINSHNSDLPSSSSFSPLISTKLPPTDKPKTTKDQPVLKKDFFPGPFSIQHLQDKANKTVQPKNKLHQDHNYEDVVEDTIWPFHINKDDAEENVKHYNLVHNNHTISDDNNTSYEENTQYIPDSEYEDQDDIPDTNEEFLHHPFPLLPHGSDKIKPTKSKEKEKDDKKHDDFLHHPFSLLPQGSEKGKQNKHKDKEDKEHQNVWNFNPNHPGMIPQNEQQNNNNNNKLINQKTLQNDKNIQFNKGNKIVPPQDQMFLNQNLKVQNPSKIEHQGAIQIVPNDESNNKNNNQQIYLIPNHQQIPYENNNQNAHVKNTDNPIIHIPDFHVPFAQHDKQKSKDVINNGGIQELIPIINDNNDDNNNNKHVNGISQYHLPQGEIYTHLQHLPQHFTNVQNNNNKDNQQNHNLPPGHEILHVIQQQQQQLQQQQNLAGNNRFPNRYLSPEEIYLVDHQDKITEDDKGRLIFNRNPLIHQKQKQGIIQIHNPNIPLPHHVLPVDEIIAHIRQQEEEEANQRYPYGSAIPHQHPFIPPPIRHNQEQQLTPPSHPQQQQPIRQIPIITHYNNPSSDLQTQHTSSPLLLGHGHGHGQQFIQNSSRQGLHNQHLPPGFPSGPAQDPNEIKVHTLEAIDESTVRLVFSVPGVLVGLHGRVELRYTADKQNSDPSTWEQQVLAPEDDLIATPELEFQLGGLQPDTSYKIKIAVVLRDLQNSPASKILTVKTPPPLSATTLPAMIPVEPDLRIAEINSTWARLVWRKFTDHELQFIDGVQLRYKETDDKVYAATPLIHRAVTSYILEGLKPDSQYEVGIFFIPFAGQTTELTAQRTLHLSTSIENDPYKFELNLDVHHIKATSVELSWSGVPYPEDKYVNIFRAIYQSDGGKEDFNSFKVAKRDSPPSTLIKALKPNTRYRLWLEAYLTNGRIKKSNVKDFTTKPGPITVDETHLGKLEGMPLVEANDYYGPLVAVSILAALAIVAVMILLLILARKHGHNKAPITTATTRKVQSAAYDNPSYKTCESDMANGRTELTIMNPNA